MLGLSNLLLVGVAAQAVFANPIQVRTDYAVKEVHQAPRRWAPVSRAPPNHMLHLQIGLKQERFDELEQQLLEGTLTDPASDSCH
jgi:tripeptidyl-peptidase I